MTDETTAILEKLEKERREIKKRHDRAALFKSRAEVVAAVKWGKAQAAEIREVAAEHESFIRRAESAGVQLRDGELRRSTEEFFALSATAARIEAGISWLADLRDEDFDVKPYPTSSRE